MVSMRVARDPRVGLGSPELRLVYPQLIAAPLRGPDHVGAVVVRAQLLGGDPRATAERVVKEARELGLLVPEGDALVSVHRPQPRRPLPADPAERRAAELEAEARRGVVRRARKRGLTPEQALDGYVYTGGGASGAAPRLSGADDRGASGADAPVDAPRLEGKEEEEESSSSSPSSPGVSGGYGGSGTPRATHGGGGSSGMASAPSRHRTHPPPPHPPYPLTIEQVMGILSGTSYGRIGDGTANVRAWFMYRLVELKVTEAQLRRVAVLAKDGNLHGQEKRLKERGLKSTDLLILAAPDGEPEVLVMWLNAAKQSLLEEQERREKADEKLRSQRNLPLPDNARETSSNRVGPPPAPVEPAATMNPRLADKLTSMNARLAAPVRAEPSHAPPSAASGNDPPPK